MKVEFGKVVAVEYTGTLGNGEVFDSSDGKEPLEFQVGSGMIIDGFEQAVVGMEIGEEKSISIPPAEAYGERDESLVRTIPRALIEGKVEPEEGMTLLVHLENNDELPVTVRKVTAETVDLDPNHPLAGETLNFKIKVLEVKDGDPNACGCGCGCGNGHQDSGCDPGGCESGGCGCDED
jgi:peptidylprolyl isomerase